MRAPAEFRILGPVEAQVGDELVALGPPQRRAVLAALAVDAGRLVTVDALVDRVWGADAPAKPRAALYGHVTRLRQALTGNVLNRRSSGYVLEVDREAVDLHRFRALLDAARATDLPERRTELLRSALDLWRGTPLADLSGEWAAGLRAGLEQQYLGAITAWADAQIDGGRPRSAVDPLAELIAQHPLVEPLVAALMRALHADGRSAEALAQFAQLRQRLDEELGTEPSPALRELHATILRGGVPDPQPAGPAQLPADVTSFTGRLDELDALDGLLDARPGAVVISAVSGTAGVGKTALAVHWAHRVRDRFPDGQLYVDLRGYDPDQPVPPERALAGFLRALGVPGPKIPNALDERAALYRTQLSRRRMLVLLDNASSDRQVRPLLPGTGGSLVVTTSRDSLAGLVARDGARRINLDVLPAGDAIDLLHTLIGDRVVAEPGPSAQLADRCAYLPLVLRIAAEMAAARPVTPVSALVAELAADSGGLELLAAGGDEQTAVRAVFSWSCRALPPPALRAFRLLGLDPAGEIDTNAAAALFDTTEAQARHRLGVLVKASLVTRTGTGRYTMHDLLRAYAAERADAEEPDRDAALTRLFDHYAGAAVLAVNTVFPQDRHRRPDVTPPPTVTRFESAAQARHWLDTNRSALVTTIQYAARHGWPSYAITLSNAIHGYLDTGGYYSDNHTIHIDALNSAEELDDRNGQALALHHLGVGQYRWAQLEPAREYFERALAAYRDCGDRHGEAAILNNLGNIEGRLARYDRALEHFQRAYELFRETGARADEGRALTGMGGVSEASGRYAEATEYYLRAVEVAEATGDQSGGSIALGNLGNAYGRLGRFAEAVAYHHRAIAIRSEAGDRVGAARSRANLSDAYRRLGDYESSISHGEPALTVFEETGDESGATDVRDTLGAALHALGRDGEALGQYGRGLESALRLGERAREASIRNGIGAVHRARGRFDDALTEHHAALALAEEIGDRYEAARAHDGIAAIHADQGDRDTAITHWRRALELYTDLGVPDADRVRDHLTAD
jgi:DNA-binding SARP family transcriptional activator/tetratricopeptide (TPR) repeat protein